MGNKIVKNCDLKGCDISTKNTYCNKHECKRTGCNVIAIDMDYCVLHRCKFCNKQKKKIDVYCKTHKCKYINHYYGINYLNNCKNFNDGLNYCKEHRCDYVNCNKNGINNHLGSGKKSCAKHKCKNCSNPISSNYKFCIDCKCAKCNKRKTICKEHICINSNCRNYIEDIMVCDIHKCIIKGCKYKNYNLQKYSDKETVKFYCDVHFELN